MDGVGPMLDRFGVNLLGRACVGPYLADLDQFGTGVARALPSEPRPLHSNGTPANPILVGVPRRPPN